MGYVARERFIATSFTAPLGTAKHSLDAKFGGSRSLARPALQSLKTAPLSIPRQARHFACCRHAAHQHETRRLATTIYQAARCLPQRGNMLDLVGAIVRCIKDKS